MAFVGLRCSIQTVFFVCGARHAIDIVEVLAYVNTQDALQVCSFRTFRKSRIPIIATAVLANAVVVLDFGEAPTTRPRVLLV